MVTTVINADAEQLFEHIIDEAYLLLSADRISVFKYDDETNNLACFISKDIKGAVIPADSGLVGYAFKKLKVINSPNVITDPRHFDRFDSVYGYEPKSSICAPIVNHCGKPIGVVQALNKKNAENFTCVDELKLIEICSYGASLLEMMDPGWHNSSSEVLDNVIATLSKFPTVFPIHQPMKYLFDEIIVQLSNLKSQLVNPKKTRCLASTSEILQFDYTREQLFSWEFNFLEVPNTSTVRVLLGTMLSMMFDYSELKINSLKMHNYLLEVEKYYQDNPFHNLYHAASVTQVACMISEPMGAREKLGLFQHFAVIFSAVIHDIDHPGNTNAFEVNSISARAILYNDQSILENHHCSTAFKLLYRPTLNFIEDMPLADQKEFRKMAISSILATDMAVHFQLVDDLNKKISNGWVVDSPTEKLFFGKILLHAADLSNPVRKFEIAKSWAERISEEFNNQVERESSLGLPVLPFMISTNQFDIAKNEISFNSFVVAPMWQSIVNHFTDLNHLQVQLDSNLLSWKTVLENESNNSESNP